jgi:hypothetical protein
MEIQDMTPEQFHQHQDQLRAALRDTDIETYYAVNADGHSDGWSGALLSLRNLIKDRLGHFQEAMNEPDIHPENLQELFHAQNGMAAVFGMINQLEK